ncbi:MAG: thioredoxin domain-containing protein [Myxococcales bacterium]|nr:thioredoxin domain-containing protein [Myxococcales bacterium]
MSRGSAIIAIMIAFVGGFAIGQITGSKDGGGEEVAAVELGRGGPAPSAAGAAAPAEGAGDVVRYRVPITADQPSKGPADALVSIVVWSEFQCPFCARVLPTLSRIQNEYRGQVRVVWRNNPLPFHQEATPAAILAMEAFEQGGADKFWQVHDLLFENQRALGREDLERYAQQAGLNMQQVRAALDNQEHKDKIDADQALANSLGARGTPAFFINGVQLMGAQPFEAFKEVIDRELATARAMVQRGTPAAQVYANLIRDGRTSPAPAADAPERPQQPQRQPDPNAVYKVELSGPLPQRGPNDALVTIVEVSDFECPFCSRVEPTIDRLLEEYPRDVRVVWLNNPLPFHRNAGPAHQLAVEAFEQGGNEKFWRLHKILFENQRELTRENLERWAQEIGLNMARVRSVLDNNTHARVIEQQQELVRGFGATGTPSFFINGRNLRGAQPYERFKAMVDEELAKARALVERGTPRNRVYATIIASGATEPQFIDAPGAAAPAAQPSAPPAPERYEIPVPRNAPTKGAARGARVVIQEFSDFECPFCGRVNPTLRQILDEYGNRVQIIWRNYPLPFHQNAHLASQAAMEAFRQGGNDKFWAYHDLLFENQRAMARADLERYAEQIGLNMAQFRAALDSERHKAAVDEDMAAVERAGARIGTPSFFINGRLLQGAQPFEAFKREIDAALAE